MTKSAGGEIPLRFFVDFFVECGIIGMTRERKDAMTNELRITMTLHEHKKLRSAVRYYLAGKQWHIASKAMNFAEHYHTGTRKDGKTPEFDHQVRIAHFVRTLPDLMYPQETLATVFLHDVEEDYDVPPGEVEKLFGVRIAFSNALLTKQFKDKVFLPSYFDGIKNDSIASIVKGADRVHNLQSMIGPFDLEKQKAYIDEVKVYFLPMLKHARRLFPEQEAAYMNIKYMLVSQIELIEAIHGAIAENIK